MPIDAVYVGRPTPFGNPHPVGRACPICHVWHTRDEAIALYCLELSPDVEARARRELRGRDVWCWCPAHRPCHGDFLLTVANA